MTTLLDADLLEVADLTVYDTLLATTRVVRVCTSTGFVTQPAETPANTPHEPLLLSIPTTRRDAFAEATTSGRSQVGLGDAVLDNAEGQLDFLTYCRVDGRSITVRRGSRFAAFPGGFTTTLVATMERLEFTDTQVIVKLKDRQTLLDVPFQTTKYAGTNSLPAGLEGVEDIKGKPKPDNLGRTRNLEPICVNTVKQIYQVSHGAVSSVSAFDSGIYLGLNVRSWTNKAAGVFSGAPFRVVYGNGVWVAIGNSAGGGSADPIVAYSNDNGETWTPVTGIFTVTIGSSIKGLCFGNGIFVIVGEQGQIATSADGAAWTLQTSGTTEFLLTVCYSDVLNTFLAGGTNGKLIVSTNNAVTWASKTSTFGSSAIGCSAWGKNIFVIGSGNSDGKVATSPDALTFTARNSSSSSNFAAIWYDVAYGEDQFVMVGELGIIIVSEDGKFWTQRASGVGAIPTTGTTLTLQGVAYGNGNWIVGVGAADFLLSIDNAKTFKRVPHNATAGAALVRAGYNGSDRFVACLTTGLFVTPLSAGTYASLADLEDDTLAPDPGTYKVYLAGGYIRLGLKPLGRLTANVIQRPAGNQLLRSQEFDDATWAKTNVTVTANNTTAPDGTMTADKIAATATAATLLTQDVTATSTEVTFSIYAKKGTGATKANAFFVYNTTTATPLLGITVNYDTGVITYGTGSTGARMKRVAGGGGGWWRLTLTVKAGISVGNTLTVYAGFTGGSNPAGDYCYVWGAQLDPRAFAAKYRPTTTAAAEALATAAQFAFVIFGRAGLTSADWSGDDLCDLDDAIWAELADWIAEERTCSTEMDLVTTSVGAGWWPDRVGVFRIQQLTDPAENKVANPSALNTAPWTGVGTYTNAYAVSDGTVFSRLQGDGTTNYRYQPNVPLIGDTAKVLSFKVRHTGATGVEAVILLDAIASVYPAIVFMTFNSDGTITFRLDAGQSMRTARLPEGSYHVRVITTAVTAANRHDVYASSAGAVGLGATGVTDWLAGDFRVEDEVPALTILRDMLKAPLMPRASNDQDRGIPTTRTTMRYSRNLTPMTTGEIAVAVTPSSRADLTVEWREATTVDAAILTASLLAPHRVVETLLADAADAVSEGTRLQALRGVARQMFDVTIDLDDDALPIDLLSKVELADHPRYYIGAGRSVRVLGVDPHPDQRTVTLTVWG